jgi:hypothetical protein
MLRTALRASILIAACAMPGFASDLSAPTGEVLLTVSGNVAVTNGDGIAEFDLEMLEAFAPTTIDTSTIWTEGVHRFQGVSLKDLVETLGIEGATLRATAINDYAIEIPVSDAVEGGPILAYRIDGNTMSVRDKGPLWVIYPYDDNADFRKEVIYSRSIWQLDRIEAFN